MAQPFQFTRAWLIAQTAFVAVGCAGARLVITPGGPSALQHGMGCLIFLIGSLGAIGGLYKRSLAGFSVGALIGFLLGTIVLLFIPMPIH